MSSYKMKATILLGVFKQVNYLRAFRICMRVRGTRLCRVLDLHHI